MRSLPLVPGHAHAPDDPLGRRRLDEVDVGGDDLGSAGAGRSASRPARCSASAPTCCFSHFSVDELAVGDGLEEEHPLAGLADGAGGEALEVGAARSSPSRSRSGPGP